MSWFELIVVVGIWVVIWVVVALSYRYGYKRGYAAKERMIWDEDGKRIREYRSTSRPRK